MIRVLFVGQSYIVGESRKKLAHLATYPGLQVSLIVPTTWEHNSFGRYDFEPGPMDALVRVYPVPLHNNGRVFAFAYALSPLWHALKENQPHIMQVEQEPGSLALTQFVLASTWQRAKLIAFTWENLFYRQPGVRHHLERLALARLDYLLAGSTTTAQVFQRKGYKGPMKVLPNVGIDSEHFAPRPQPDLRQSLGLGDRFVVGFAGRLVPEKGCEDLMRAFAELPDCCHLLMVGGGRERERLSQLAHSLDIAQRVTFQPTVPHREVPRYLNCMDCLVLSSHTTPIWAEQFGLILAQAMACGVPVVGSDCGAIPEVISDAGLIFPEGDVEALRTNLLQLQTDPALRTALSARGRARVEAHYTHQRIAEQTFALYQQVMSSRR